MSRREVVEEKRREAVKGAGKGGDEVEACSERVRASGLLVQDPTRLILCRSNSSMNQLCAIATAPSKSRRSRRYLADTTYLQVQVRVAVRRDVQCRAMKVRCVSLSLSVSVSVSVGCAHHRIVQDS